jgi:hypothetical protein
MDRFVALRRLNLTLTCASAVAAGVVVIYDWGE